MNKIYKIRYNNNLENVDKLQQLLCIPNNQFLDHSESCYVYYHFGKQAEKIQRPNLIITFNNLKEDVLFCMNVENKFNVHVNFINLEPIINEIVEFNNNYPNMKISGNDNDICTTLMNISYDHLQWNIHKF